MLKLPEDDIREMAIAEYEDGLDIAIDDGAEIRYTDDKSGAWVQAWVYVDLEENEDE